MFCFIVACRNSESLIHVHGNFMSFVLVLCLPCCRGLTKAQFFKPLVLGKIQPSIIVSYNGVFGKKKFMRPEKASRIRLLTF